MMKFAICLLSILGSCLALPSSRGNWEDIKGNYVYLDPISNETIGERPSVRVIGGDEVAPSSRQYQVAIFVNGRSFCGGSMISTNYVLTAAHCTIQATYVELIFGAHSIQTQESTQVLVTSRSILNHPDYQANTFANDIALIKTPVPIVTNTHIRVVLLAPNDGETYDGQKAFFTGWGKVSDASSISTVLRGVELNVISNALCARTFGSNVLQSTLCTSGDGNVGGCDGDSGSPLVVGNVQVGIMAFLSSRGCEAGAPTGFTRISSFKKWITDNSDAPV